MYSPRLYILLNIRLYYYSTPFLVLLCMKLGLVPFLFFKTLKIEIFQVGGCDRKERGSEALEGD